MPCCCFIQQDDDNISVPILQSAKIGNPEDPKKKRGSINDHTITNDESKMGNKMSKEGSESEKMMGNERQSGDGMETDKMVRSDSEKVDDEVFDNVKPVIPLAIIDDEKLEDHEEDMAEHHRKDSITLSKDQLDELYYKAEFTCMDLGKDNLLSYSEFVRLIVGLGYHLGVQGAKQVWKECGKYESSYMSLQEYINLMKNNKELEKATSGCRSVFAAFDWDSSGWASKSDIIQGLEDVLGIPVTPQLEEKIQSMDSNKDGCIYYGDYLLMQLKGFK